MEIGHYILFVYYEVSIAYSKIGSFVSWLFIVYCSYMAESSKTTWQVDTGTMFRAVFVVLFFVFLFFIRELLLIFFTALVVASFIEPVVDKFKKYKIPRLLTVMAIFTLSTLFIAGLLYILIPTLFSELASLVQLISKFLPEESFLHTFDQATVVSTQKLFTSIGSIPFSLLI